MIGGKKKISFPGYAKLLGVVKERVFSRGSRPGVLFRVRKVQRGGLQKGRKKKVVSGGGG